MPVAILKDAVAKALASAHYMFDPEITKIYRLLSDDEESQDEPIKLLELNNETVPVGIEPVIIGPRSEDGNLYRIVIVAITPAEFTPEIKKALEQDYGGKVGPSIDAPSEVGTGQT